MRVLAAMVLAVAAVSCGGDEARARIEAGYAALHSGEPLRARLQFETALTGLEPGETDYLVAAVGRLRALAHTDAREAVRELVELCERASVDSKQFRSIALELTDAGAFSEAVEVLGAGRAAHPEYPKWRELIERVGNRAMEASGDWEGQHWLDQRLIARPARS